MRVAKHFRHLSTAGAGNFNCAEQTSLLDDVTTAHDPYPTAHSGAFIPRKTCPDLLILNLEHPSNLSLRQVTKGILIATVTCFIGPLLVPLRPLLTQRPQLVEFYSLP